MVDAFFAIQDEIAGIKSQFGEDNPEVFEIPEYKSLIQKHHTAESSKGASESEIEGKKSQDLISASEIRYRRLFETAQDGILIIDAETEEITDVNPFLSDMLGYDKEHFLGKRLWEIGFFKDITASRQAFNELQAKGFIRYEDLPLETKDGRSKAVEFVSNVYTVDGDKVIQCNIRDITERKIAEEALARAAARDSAISILACRLVSSISLSDISGLILQTAQRFTGSACGYIGYMDLDSGTMISPPAIHEIEHSADAPEETGSVKRLDGLGAWVLNNPQSFLTNAAASDPRFAANLSCGVPIHNLTLCPGPDCRGTGWSVGIG